MTTEPPLDGVETTIDPLLAEDLLLLLFQPRHGTIAGENTLFYVLAGAVVAELAQRGSVTLDERGVRATLVSAVGDTAPADPVLAQTWDYVADKPRNVQTVLAAMGPTLRTVLLDRLVQRGDLRREESKTFGIFPTTRIVGEDPARRRLLVRRLRAVLVDGEAADDRTASLIALVSASGTLPHFDSEIPWTFAVATRAKEFERIDRGADAAGAAVTRTMTAIVVNAAVAASILPRT